MENGDGGAEVSSRPAPPPMEGRRTGGGRRQRRAGRGGGEGDCQALPPPSTSRHCETGGVWDHPLYDSGGGGLWAW